MKHAMQCAAPQALVNPVRAARRRYRAGWVLWLAGFAFAQQPNFGGDYSGMLGPFHVQLHLTRAAAGTLSCTVDSPDQGAFGVPCADVNHNGASLSFTVPSIHGAWSGFVSTDGNTLSGVYNQGQSFPLNWTRAGAAATAPAAASTVRAGAVGGTTSITPSGEPACPANSLGNYWDGSGWKPLTMAVALPKERGLSIRETLKDPINPMAGYTTIMRYKGPAATLALNSTPRFCFPVSVNTAPDVVIGELSVKKNERQIEMRLSDVHNSQQGVPARNAVEVEVRRTSPTTIEATPKQPLRSGQYVITSSYGMYDFGVQ